MSSSNYKHKSAVKSFFILLFLFLLDLIRPFGYSLSIEFLFLGIIFISLNEKFLPSLALSIIFGCIKTSFIAEATILHLTEYPLFCLSIRYLYSHFPLVNIRGDTFTLKFIITLAAFTVYIAVNSLSAGVILPFFSLKFLIQSLLIYFLLEYLLLRKKEIQTIYAKV